MLVSDYVLISNRLITQKEIRKKCPYTLVIDSKMSIGYFLNAFGIVIGVDKIDPQFVVSKEVKLTSCGHEPDEGSDEFYNWLTLLNIKIDENIKDISLPYRWKLEDLLNS